MIYLNTIAKSNKKAKRKLDQLKNIMDDIPQEQQEEQLKKTKLIWKT